MIQTTAMFTGRVSFAILGTPFTVSDIGISADGSEQLEALKLKMIPLLLPPPFDCISGNRIA